MKKTVWFNKHLSGIGAIMADIKASDRENRYRVLCTHTQEHFLGFSTADVFEREPDSIDDMAYLSYALEVCRRHDVALFVPGRRAAFLARHRDRFREAGVGLLTVGGAEVLELVDRKDRLFAALCRDGLGDLVPPFRVVRTAAEFDGAVGALREPGGRLCVKPVQGMNGQGFRVLVDDDRGLDAFLGGDGTILGHAFFRRLLAEGERFRPLLVMPYLEGVEHSVDVLARGGEMVRCVARRKAPEDGAFQRIEDIPELFSAVGRLTAMLKLDAVFNVQFREHRGTTYLLEINGRMAGGVIFSTLTGLDMPYWALRLAAGDCTLEEIPMPRTGFYIAQSVRGDVRDRPRVPGNLPGGPG